MAKCAMYYIDNHKIEVVNTFMGKEKIFLNGVKVSEKYADIGDFHTFLIGKNNYRISHRDLGYGKSGNTFEIRKNGMPLSLTNLLPQTSAQLFVLVVILGLGFGFILGILFYNLFWPAMGI